MALKRTVDLWANAGSSPSQLRMGDSRPNLTGSTAGASLACALTVCAHVEWFPTPRSRLDENFNGKGLELSKNGDGSARSDDARDLFFNDSAK